MEITSYLPLMILIFSRVAAIFSIIPIFSSRNAPMQLRIGFIFFVSLVMFPMLVNTGVLIPETFGELLVSMVTEIVIGLTLGFSITFTINSIYLAGTLVDRNIGFAMVSVMSATDESQMPVTANFYYILSMMIFLISDYHLRLIEGLALSFKEVPIGTNNYNVLMAKRITDILGESFVIAFKMAAPFLITIIVANIILGLLSKAMPGLNVFMVGMPLKILIGFIIFLIITPYYMEFFNNLFHIMFQQFIDIIMNLAA
ncbi:MAG: flagellar biosynthetic protein FliR [Firmicutes bacterium]|jgi:flagellar biosynthetic protein FliR|nr:flagellar biosynthetic protein FliR [Bacillota bacterium]